MGHRVISLAPANRPDIRASTERMGRSCHLGMEVTTYQVDARPGMVGGSPGLRLHGFWRRVQEELIRLLKEAPSLTHTCGLVLLKGDSIPPMSVAAPLAKELVRLSGSCCPIPPSGIERTDFVVAYPLLRQYMCHVRLKDVSPAVMHRWECINVRTAEVRLNLDHVVASIKMKAEKCGGYTWSDLDEKWLLLCAPGYPVFCTAGLEPAGVDWNTPALRDVCQRAGFDRIFFWERYYRWSKPIWPDAPILAKEWRVTP